MYTATYSPEDNKLRLYSSARLDAETYAKVKALGFKWAPKQDLWVAPMWTPEREDVLIELAGEIEDEDKSLVDRQEERAERFEQYSDNRAADAQTALKAVDAICEHIPLGQPILIGHHSERHARRDAKRIEDGMRKTVKMWETSKYWASRAAGAVAHAKYKELPAVRARRIKGLESDERKQLKYIGDAEKRLKFYSRDDLTLEMVLRVENFGGGGLVLPDGERHWSAWSVLTDGKVTMDYVIARRRIGFPKSIAHHQRWLQHYQNRLVYERAMLGAAGGLVTDKTGPEIGGGVMCWAGPRGGWAYIVKVNKVTVSILMTYHGQQTDRKFRSNIAFDKCKAVMSKAEVEAARSAGTLVESADGCGFFLAAAPKPSPVEEKKPEKPIAADIDAMKQTLKAGGVKVVVAPQLFPTPAAIAAQMIEAAAIEPGMCVLEPSAGTGNLVKAVLDTVDTEVLAYEINQNLCSQLARTFPDYKLQVRCKDFLEVEDFIGCYPRVVMNPPFENGADIRHIKHALRFLAPGGRLVALCADGPRQREQLGELGTYEPLPAGSFAAQGTAVNVAMVTIDV